MAFADQINPYFSFVDGLSGVRLVGFLGRNVPGEARTPFEAYVQEKIDLDAPIRGFWSPAGRFLTFDGEISVTIDEVDAVGRYLVIEKNGAGTIETSGERHLEEGEVFVAQGFLDSVPAGMRHAQIALSLDADNDCAGPDDDLDAIGINGAGLGRA